LGVRIPRPPPHEKQACNRAVRVGPGPDSERRAVNILKPFPRNRTRLRGMGTGGKVARTERWPSGRRRHPAKVLWAKVHRGFESLPLRHPLFVTHRRNLACSAGCPCAGFPADPQKPTVAFSPPIYLTDQPLRRPMLGTASRRSSGLRPLRPGSGARDCGVSSSPATGGIKRRTCPEPAPVAVP
jgi:hypothetical protein